MKRLEDVTDDDVAKTLIRLLESRATEPPTAVPYLTVDLVEHLVTLVQGPAVASFHADLMAGKAPSDARVLEGNALPAILFHLGFLAGRESTESDQFAAIMGAFGDDTGDAWAKAEAALALDTAVAAEPESPEQYRMIGSDDDTIYSSRARCLAAAQEYANTHDRTVIIEERRVPVDDPDQGWQLIDSIRPQGG